MASERPEVRALTVADAESLWAMRLRALREHPEAFGRSYEETRDIPLDEVHDRFRTDWAPPANVVLGAFLDGQLVGTTGLYRVETIKERHKATIWGVYVAPDARGRGLGRALLEAAIAHAATLPGIEQLRLSVGSRSTAARALYTSLGFAPYGLERAALKLDDGYVDEEHLVLHLLPPPPP